MYVVYILKKLNDIKAYLGELPWLENGSSSLASKKSSSPSELEYEVSGTNNVNTPESKFCNKITNNIKTICTKRTLHNLKILKTSN